MPCSPSVIRSICVSQVASSFAPASSRAASSIARIDRIGHRKSRGEQCFAAVRFHRGDLAPVDLAVRVRIRGRDLAGRIEIGGNLPDEFGAKKTLCRNPRR